MGSPSSMFRITTTSSARTMSFLSISSVVCIAWILILTSSASPATALIHAVDSSANVPTSTYSKALSQGFTKAIIRGYKEACSQGGGVDPNFVTAYNNAVSAGYKDIDTYWFPCTSSAYPCKSYSTQLSELGSVFNSNKLKIGTIWIDIEKSSSCTQEWNFGTAGNAAQARKLVSAAKNSGYKIGIYSSSGQWSTIFGSYSVDIGASDLRLWNAQWDNNDGSLAMTRSYGGWTSAFAKQYTDQSASGYFDLNIFSS